MFADNFPLYQNNLWVSTCIPFSGVQDQTINCIEISLKFSHPLLKSMNKFT